MSMSMMEIINSDELGRETMPTLKAVAYVIGANYMRLRSVAKKPEQGEVYDARKFNWNAVETYIQQRLDAGRIQGCESIVDVLIKAIDADKKFKLTDSCTRAQRGYVKMITTANGKQVPRRRYAFNVGDKTQYRDNSDVLFEVVYTTPTHIVLRVFGGDTLTTLANSTVNAKLVPPAKICQSCIIVSCESNQETEEED